MLQIPFFQSVGEFHRRLDGEDYFVVVRDVTMDSHPAYTGEKRIVDTAGRVEKFTTKFKRGGAKSAK